MKKTYFLFLAFALCYTTVWAQSSLNTSFRFLEMPSSARSAALGGQVVSLPNGDISLFHINPGYLNEDLNKSVSVSYINHISDINMASVNGAYYLKDIGTLAAGLRYMGYGSFTRTDAQGQSLGSFNAYDMALTFGIGRTYLKNLHYGATFDIIHSSYDIYHSTAVAFSFGFLYNYPNKDFTIGGAITNLGTQISTFDSRREPLPLDIRLGISRKLEHVPLRLSLTAHSLNRWNLWTFDDAKKPGFTSNLLRHFNIGGEFLLSSNVELRLGYNRYQHEELKASNRLDFAGTSIGLGIHIDKYQFDISRNSFSQTGGYLQINLRTKF